MATTVKKPATTGKAAAKERAKPAPATTAKAKTASKAQPAGATKANGKVAAKASAKPQPAQADAQAKAQSKAASKAAAKASEPAAPAGKGKGGKAAQVPPPVVAYVSAFAVGSRITHSTFGDGKVLAVDGEKLTIKFASAEKVIIDSFVKSAPKG